MKKEDYNTSIPITNSFINPIENVLSHDSGNNLSTNPTLTGADSLVSNLNSQPPGATDKNRNLQNQCDIFASQHINNVLITNSSDITLGNKNFYQGPVTINQFLTENKLKTDIKQGNLSDKRQLSNVLFTFKIWKNQFNITRKLLYIIIVAVITLSIFITTFAILMISDPKTEDNFIPKLISRDEWLARPPLGPLIDLEHPAKRIIIAHTVGESCKTEATCKLRTRIIQNISLSKPKEYNDLPYNFLIGGDGNVYEGRGWDKISAVAAGFNQGSISLGFIGTFITVEPTKHQLKAGKWIINEALRLNKLNETYLLNGARQLTSTESPGEKLFNIIKNWPHFSEEI